MPPQLWLLVAAAGYQPTARPSAPRHAERSSTAHVTAGATSSVALAFGDALAKAWQRDTEPLRQLLRDDAVVDTPIWSCEGAVDYLEKLGEAAEFFSRESPPRLSVLAEEALGPGMARVEWMLGVEWPAFWRARINVLGESVVRFELGEGERVLVRAVEETWHESPDQLFLQQVLPRRRDLMSLWNSPTAEHVPQRVERVAKGYELRRLPAMLAVQAETVETGGAGCGTTARSLGAAAARAAPPRLPGRRPPGLGAALRARQARPGRSGSRPALRPGRRRCGRAGAGA